jgi:broad specificity phosphatase PhoE
MLGDRRERPGGSSRLQQPTPRLSRIHLIRHGQPACRPQPALSRKEYRRWVEAYDASGIIDLPPRSLVQWLGSAGVDQIISSALLRAVETAEALIGSGRLRSDPLFNEAGVVITPIPFRLSSNAWTAFGRLAWVCGASADEAAARFRLRARTATDSLVGSASMTETALVGHGWMNRMIGRELRKRGFEIQHHSGSGYWSRTTFEQRS